MSDCSSCFEAQQQEKNKEILVDLHGIQNQSGQLDKVVGQMLDLSLVSEKKDKIIFSNEDDLEDVFITIDRDLKQEKENHF